MHCRRSCACLLVFSFTVFALGRAQQTALPPQAISDQTQLKIDPRLILEAEEIWDLIAAKENPVWPGWNASDTPILFYLPGVQDVLIGHPHPPEGFVRYQGPVRFGDKSIYIKNGATIFSIDGQNTNYEINGVQTLVVADTLSNLRNNIMGFAQQFSAGQKPISFGELETDPYDQMAMVAHEAFHVYQAHSAPEKQVSESVLIRYPVLSPENNAGFALEAEALLDALHAKDSAEMRRAAVRWLAIRHARRAHLSAEAIAYEDGDEFTEGLAKYIEYRLSQVLEGRKPADSMMWVQGFSGYGNLSAQRARLLLIMQKAMNGSLNVNNAPYGSAPVRMRLYSSGMAIAALLDGIAPEWKQKIFAPNASLTGLVENALQASPQELDRIWEQEKSTPAYAAWLTKKKELQRKGVAHAEAALRQIEAGEGIGVTIDASQLPLAHPNLTYTPFGLTSVDENRTIYGMIPIGATWSKQDRLTEKISMPVLVDEAKKQLRFRLPSSVSTEEAKKVIAETGEAGREISLDGQEFSLKAACAQIRWQGREVVITLLPAVQKK